MGDKKIAPSSSCWRCGIGAKTIDLISPCKCKDKVIHVYCLKIIANTEGKLYCPFCNALYPLEKRPKSEMIEDICKYFIALLFVIILIPIIGLILYSMLLKVLDLLNIKFPFIVNIIGLGICFWFIYKTVVIIFNLSNKIYELCQQWYQSTYEWEVKGSSTVNNTEEYNIEEIKT